MWVGVGRGINIWPHPDETGIIFSPVLNRRLPVLQGDWSPHPQARFLLLVSAPQVQPVWEERDPFPSHRKKEEFQNPVQSQSKDLSWEAVNTMPLLWVRPQKASGAFTIAGWHIAQDAFIGCCAGHFNCVPMGHTLRPLLWPFKIQEQFWKQREVSAFSSKGLRGGEGWKGS